MSNNQPAASQGDAIEFAELPTQSIQAPTQRKSPPADDTLLEITAEAQAKAKELGLNYRQETFAHLVANNKPAITAYRLAGYNCEPVEHATANASRLTANDRVQELIGWLRRQKLSQHTFTRDAKRRLLYKIGNESQQDANRLRAIEIDNRMTGDDAPVRIEGELTLTAILQGVSPSLGLPDDAIDV